VPATVPFVAAPSAAVHVAQPTITPAFAVPGAITRLALGQCASVRAQQRHVTEWTSVACGGALQGDSETPEAPVVSSAYLPAARAASDRKDPWFAVPDAPSVHTRGHAKDPCSTKLSAVPPATPAASSVSWSSSRGDGNIKGSWPAVPAAPRVRAGGYAEDPWLATWSASPGAATAARAASPPSEGLNIPAAQRALAGGHADDPWFASLFATLSAALAAPARSPSAAPEAGHAKDPWNHRFATCYAAPNAAPARSRSGQALVHVDEPALQGLRGATSRGVGVSSVLRLPEESPAIWL